MIHNIGPQFSQWDIGRSVKVTDSEATHVHFANQGDTKAVIIQIENGSATIPNYLLQTGKTLVAYAVLNGVTLESKSFPVRKRERPESYVYEDDSRNYIYELITSAESAVVNANRAAGLANNAADGASLAAKNASEATDSARNASDSANLAAKNANEAASKAVNTAKNLMVVGEAEGANILLNNAIEQNFVGLRIFGKTTQNGTPTPEAPVELVSLGDSGSITVNVTGANDAQSMTIATPNGLPGIPVPSGGNYTDASGQQWVCDEIDFTRGVYVQRINTVDFETADGSRTVSPGDASTYRFAFTLNRNPTYLPSSHVGGMCNALTYDSAPVGYNRVDNAIFAYIDGGIYVRCDAYKTADEFVAWAKSIDLKVQYTLKTPIERPLTEEEIAAYAALHTYKDYTAVSNDASAHMELEYAMDAKKYIDSLIGSGGTGGSGSSGGTAVAASARLTDVSLPASSWEGSDGLYSQVISVDGVTPTSKVDLLPSVEQLTVFYDKDLTLLTENEGGVVTAYAIGDKPANDYTMQAQLTEIGSELASTLPKAEEVAF